MSKRKKQFQLFGLLGFPLGHTLSPPMHMAGLQKLGITGSYIPFEIDPKKFDAVMAGFRHLPFAGCNVTVPYKEKVLPYLDTLSPEARIIGAVNTIQIGRQYTGHNTDAYGFERSLREDLSFDPQGKTILLIGAGGAARACMYALARANCAKIIIADCEKKRAKALCEHFSKYFEKVLFSVIDAQAVAYDAVYDEIDLLVNATPIGLKKSDPLLVPASLFARKKIAVYDLVYNPAMTKLLTTAKKKGCAVANGLNMLLYQGVRAFELWTGEKAPVADMRRALLAGLKKVI